MLVTATFSECGRFRNSLLMVWDESKPILPWVLWNPSVAGQVVDGVTKGDPTARKGRGFSERHGYGGQVFANCYNFIATEPAALKAAGFPMSPDNDAHILAACAMGTGDVVVAWGALGRKMSRPPEVLKLIRRAGYRTMALTVTKEGLPGHPLMLGYDCTLTEFTGNA